MQLVTFLFEYIYTKNDDALRTAVWVVNMDSKVCQNSWNKSLLVLNWLLFCTVNKSFSTGSFSMLFFFCTWMAKISPVSEQNFFASFSSHCQRRLEPAWLSDEWCNCAVTSAAGAYTETLSVPLQKSHFLCYEDCRRFFLPRCPYRTKLLTPFFMSFIAHFELELLSLYCWAPRMSSCCLGFNVWVRHIEKQAVTAEMLLLLLTWSKHLCMNSQT